MRRVSCDLDASLEASACVQVSFFQKAQHFAFALTLLSGTKKEHKPTLLSTDIFRWGRGLPREGVGPKSSMCPSKPGKSNFFGGISQDFAGISRKCPKSLRKKSLCSIFAPYIGDKKYYLPNLPSRRIILGNSMCFLCMEENF